MTAADPLDERTAGAAVIRGGAIRVAGYGVGMVLTLASAPLLVRHLGVVDFGRYVLVLSLILIAGGLTEAGLTAIGQREYAVREESERAALMRNLVGLRVVLTTAGVAGAVLFAVAAGYDSTLVLGTLVAGLGLIAIALQSLYAVPLSCELRFGAVTAAEVIRTAGTVAAIVGGVAAGFGLIWFLGAQIPAGLLALGITVWLIRGRTPLAPAFHPAIWWPLLRDILPYAAATAVNVTYFRISIVLMSLVATELETGYFGTSFRILEVLVVIPPLVMGAVFPVLARAARDNRERLAYAVHRVFEVAAIAGVGMTLVVALGAEPVMQVLAGDAGDPAVDVLRIQSLTMIAAFVSAAAAFPLLSLRRHRELLLANVAALVLNVALTLALAPEHGAEGVAVGTVVSETLLAVVMTVTLARSGEGVRVPWRPCLAVLAVGGLAAGAALATGLPGAVQACLGGAAFAAALAVLGLIPEDVRAALPLRRR